MIRSGLALSVLAAAAALFIDMTPAAAQATRTWVSGVGDDANPCSRTAPCKTFAGAISKTAAGGEIDCLDPGGFGAVTITKSITIDCAGTLGSILASAVNGVIVNGAGISVTLRNLSINGAGTTLGVDGIRFLAGRALHVENVRILNFSGQGIEASPSTAGDLYVRDTIISAAAGGGIQLSPTGAGTVNASIEGVHLDRNAAFGLRVEANAFAMVSGSSAMRGADGFGATGGGGLTIFDSVANSNGTGLNAGVGSTIRASEMLVTNNSTGMSGNVVSFRNVYNNGNGTDGAPTGQIAPQ